MSEVVEKKRDVTIHPSRMRLAEYDRQEWTVNAELGMTIEDVLQPSFWAHMAPQMKPYDHIEVRIDDGSWIAMLIVTSCEHNWAKVRLLQKIDLVDDMAVPIKSIVNEVAWKGPQLKWCVIRKSTGQKLKEECESREIAAAWMREHERVVT